MFIYKNLIFVELHKTGCSHIGRILSDLFSGSQEGKHNIIPKRYHNRFILGSVRNPWDWYVSLWAFGCGGKGGVRQYTTSKANISYYFRLARDMGLISQFIKIAWKQNNADTKKPISLWHSVYADNSDSKCFRKWLKLILNHDRRFDLGEGYGFSPLSKSNGLFTYRYMKFFTNMRSSLYNDVSLCNKVKLKKAWKENSIVNYIVRNENLEEDLYNGLKLAEVGLTEAQVKYIFENKKMKTNVSNHKHTGYYYDKETIDLVAEYESLVIDNHGYLPPDLNG